MGGLVEAVLNSIAAVADRRVKQDHEVHHPSAVVDCLFRLYARGRELRSQGEVPPPRALFIMDLDGTLLDSRGASSPENHEAMRRATDDGIALAIVTGRRRSTFRFERDRFTEFPFRASVSNGAVLLAADNETIEQVHPLEWEPVLELFHTISRTAASRCLAVTVPGEGATHEQEVPDALIISSTGGYYYAPSPCEPELQEAREENKLARSSALSRTWFTRRSTFPTKRTPLTSFGWARASAPGRPSTPPGRHGPQAYWFTSAREAGRRSRSGISPRRSASAVKRSVPSATASMT